MHAEGMHASSVHPRRIPRPAGSLPFTTTHFRNALDATTASSPRRRRAAADLLVSSRRDIQKHRYVPDGLSAAQWKKMQADKKKNARSRRPAVLRRLHAIDATRIHQTRSWVVSFVILSEFGPRRATASRDLARNALGIKNESTHGIVCEIRVS